jgi:hypothetical protein
MPDDPGMAKQLEEIKGLAESSKTELSVELRYVRDGLGQAQGLLQDAIQKINASFSGLDRRSQDQFAIVCGLAIRALQVEDIVNQILGNNQKRLNTIENCTAAFVSCLGSLCADQAGLAEQIDVVHQHMSSMFQKMHLDNHKPVRQQSMDEGEIELF